MKSHLKCIFFILLTTFCSSCDGNILQNNRKEQQAVKNCFEAYRQALLDMNGEEAYSCLNNNSRKSYNKLLMMCREYDSVQLSQVSTGYRFYVLATRMAWDADMLMTVSSKDFFISSVLNNASNIENLAKMKIESISVNDTNAKISVTLATGKSMTDAFSFSREDKKWKIDIFKTLEVAFDAISDGAKAEGKTENEMLYELLEKALGGQMTPEVWIPVKYRSTIKSEK